MRYEALLAVQKLMVHNWLVCVLRLSCLIPPIAHSGAAQYAHLRTSTKTSRKLVQVIPPFNQNVSLLYQSKFIAIQLYFSLSFLTLKGNTLASSWRRRTRTRNKALHPSLARPKRDTHTHTPNTHPHTQTHLTSHSYHVQPRVASCHRNLTNNKSRRGRTRRRLEKDRSTPCRPPYWTPLTSSLIVYFFFFYLVPIKRMCFSFLIFKL